MSKLRMKETTSEREARERASQAGHSLKSEHRKKRRRRRGNSNEQESQQAGPSTYYQGTDEESDADAYVPSRPSKHRPYISYTFQDSDDESRLPPPAAHKHDTATHEEDFHQRLFDAMREDEGYPDPYSISGSYAGLSFDYRENMPNRRMFGANGIADDRYMDSDTGVIVNRVIFREAMTEEEYAEHIRRGMFRRTRKEELAQIAAKAEERKLREKRKAEEIARTKALEAERIQKLEERARRKAQAGTVKSRESYQAAWARLVDSKHAGEELKSGDFPWPISPECGGILDSKAIGQFLTSHLIGTEELEGEAGLKKKRRQAIRTAILAYHPDRFEKYIVRVRRLDERESVRQMGLRVSQILNELLQDI